MPVLEPDPADEPGYGDDERPARRANPRPQRDRPYSVRLVDDEPIRARFAALPEPVRPDGIVLSKSWLAVAGVLFAGLTGLLSWGMAETTARSTQALQIEQLERRLAAQEARAEGGRATSNDTHTAIYKRIGDVSDRVARLEARLDLRRSRPNDDPAGLLWPGCRELPLPIRFLGN